jgi:hypothetical protein
MIGPRDPIHKEPTERQQFHLKELTEAGELLYATMHAAEGSAPPGEHQEHIYLSRRMAVAATHLETALMFARRAAMEAA